jgi:hypothetical protein
VVAFGVVKSGDEMRGARPAGRQADPQFAGEFGVGGSHERRHLFMPDLDEVDHPFGALQGAEDAIDAVAGVTENAAHAPFMKSMDEEVANGVAHGGGAFEETAAATRATRRFLRHNRRGARAFPLGNASPRRLRNGLRPSVPLCL